MKTITVSELEKAAGCGDCLVLDVRTPSEFAEAHIEGSVNVPLPDLGRFKTELAAKAGSQALALICKTGRRAEAALQALDGLGISNCRVLEGGIERWAGSGKPVATGRKAMSIERQVRVVAGALVALGTALGWFVHPAFLILPAFVGCGLVFAGLTDTCGMAMMLARLPMNRAKGCPLG